MHEVTSVTRIISRAVDFWVDSILQRYITEFVVEAITSYSEAMTMKKVSVIYQYMDQDARL